MAIHRRMCTATPYRPALDAKKDNAHDSPQHALRSIAACAEDIWNYFWMACLRHKHRTFAIGLEWTHTLLVYVCLQDLLANWHPSTKITPHPESAKTSTNKSKKHTPRIEKVAKKTFPISATESVLRSGFGLGNPGAPNRAPTKGERGRFRNLGTKSVPENDNARRSQIGNAFRYTCTKCSWTWCPLFPIHCSANLP